MAKCVNLRVSEYSVYIGRAGKGQDGDFGSPIVMHKPCPECNQIHRTNESTLLCYRKYVVRRVNTDFQFREKVKTLKIQIAFYCIRLLPIPSKIQSFSVKRTRSRTLQPPGRLKARSQ